MTVQEPFALIKEPEEKTTKISISTPNNSSVQFDLTKVLAAVGLILIGTIMLIGLLWIWIQSLETRVDTIEENIKVTTSSAKLATSSSPIESTATSSSLLE